MDEMHLLKRDICIEMMASGRMEEGKTITFAELVNASLNHIRGENLTIDNFVESAFDEIKEQGLGDVSYEYAMALINKKEQDYKRKQMNQAKKDMGEG